MSASFETFNQTGLASLPPELLDRIFLLAGGMSVLNAWKACNKELNCKLAVGITTIKLFDFVSASTSRWPKCLPQFQNLTHLDISNRKTQLISQEKASVELLKLSPKLKSLKLDVWGSEHFFFPPQKDIVVGNMFNEDYEDQEDENDSNLMSRNESDASVPIDLSKAFPRLETLLIAGRAKFQDYHIKYLPRTLTHLEFVWDSTVTDACIPDLPPNLKYLSFGAGVKLSPPVVSQLPRSLTHLGTKYSHNHLHHSYHLLPPSITDLEPECYNSTTLANLPPALTRIKLFFTAGFKFDMGVIAKLPKGLTEIDFGYVEPVFTPEHFRSLPRTLKRLAFFSHRQSLNGVVKSDMPPHLTHLTMTDAKIMSDDLLVLPESLTELCLKKSTLNDDKKCIENLPRMLRTLLLGVSEILTDDALVSLPRTLTKVALTGTCEITGSGFKDLPPHLTDLELPHADFLDDRYIVDLPRCIQHLKLHSASLTSACLPLLPPHLEVFNFASDSFILKASDTNDLPTTITKLDIVADLDDNIIPLLPRNLKFLQLRLVNNISKISTDSKNDDKKSFTSNMFKDLPRKLEVLTISGLIRINDNDVKYLPKTLTRLRLEATVGMTVNCVPDLPVGIADDWILPKEICKRFCSLRDQSQNAPFEEIDPKVHERFRRGNNNSLLDN